MQGYVDEEGRLVFHPDAAAQLGLQAGAKVLIDQEDGHLHVHWPVTHLAKVYIEPTSQCNMACRTCIRSAWDEPLGQMTATTFARIMDSIPSFPTRPTFFFGGFGEPLSHPAIVDMVAQARQAGTRVELITNGTLLTEELARKLIAARLDVLWVSLDGATPESYADVRLGAALPEVLANIARLRDIRPPSPNPKPAIGIVFVAVKRNIAQLPAVLELGRELGAARFLVSNILPHTPEMRDEVLYARAISNNDEPSSRLPHLRLPRMNVEDISDETLYQELCGHWYTEFVGTQQNSPRGYCPFIEAGATAIAWDGSVSPCLALLHSGTEYLNGIERFSRRYEVGNVNKNSFDEIWNAPDYVAFREKVQAFEFAPCALCDGCAQSENNEEDCYGNSFPTCGGCLWAQGMIQCP